MRFAPKTGGQPVRQHAVQLYPPWGRHAFILIHLSVTKTRGNERRGGCAVLFQQPAVQLSHSNPCCAVAVLLGCSIGFSNRSPNVEKGGERRKKISFQGLISCITTVVQQSQLKFVIDNCYNCSQLQIITTISDSDSD